MGLIMGTFEIRPFLTLSTSHISLATSEWVSFPGNINGGEMPYGWFLWCFTEPPEDLPDDLRDVFSFARENNCDYVYLDQDGPTIDGLATFEW